MREHHTYAVPLSKPIIYEKNEPALETIPSSISVHPRSQIFRGKKSIIPQQYLGGNRSTRTILCRTCAIQIIMGTVTDFRLIHREYARVIKVQSGRIK